MKVSNNKKLHTQDMHVFQEQTKEENEDYQSIQQWWIGYRNQDIVIKSTEYCNIKN